MLYFKLEDLEKRKQRYNISNLLLLYTCTHSQLVNIILRTMKYNQIHLILVFDCWVYLVVVLIVSGSFKKKKKTSFLLFQAPAGGRQLRHQLIERSATVSSPI